MTNKDSIVISLEIEAGQVKRMIHLLKDFDNLVNEVGNIQKQSPYHREVVKLLEELKHDQ